MIFPALYLIETQGRRKSLLSESFCRTSFRAGQFELTEPLNQAGASIEAVCALIAGLVGWFTLAPPGTPLQDLTPRNKQGGQVKEMIRARIE